ncbi:hypothetical protein V6N11_081129 [Hibiscus sabdariffa]|uniref:J domain-containing protein n=1 Tax=Hibiscus sabdariffa TaxID=183260 RepID=A0ABR2QIX3_9ROSI
MISNSSFSILLTTPFLKKKYSFRFKTVSTKAFRQLALHYHPDVCRGNNCGVQFQTINEAYDIVMSQLRGKMKAAEAYEEEIDEAMRGMEDSDYDMWKEFSLGNLQLSKSLQTLS